MSDVESDPGIAYIEFGAADIRVVKQFYTGVFGWTFTDYGPDYTSFTHGRLTGGFTTERLPGSSPLVVLYESNLEATFRLVQEAGGRISRETFEFPGGRRFHFIDPAGNELAVWSE